MRRLRYSVAASLDGYIAGPRGEFDWIPMDPDIDFNAMYAEYGTIVMGRASWEAAAEAGGMGGAALPVFVYSTTMPAGPRDGMTVVNDAAAHVRTLKAGDGKDIWLWGGGVLFRALADAHLVDAVTVAVCPMILGTGLPLASLGGRVPLALRAHRLYPKTGTLLLEYDVLQGAGRR